MSEPHPAADPDPADVFRRSEDLVIRRIVGETLLVPVSGQLADLEDMFSLNSTAAFIWERLDGEAALDAVQAAVVDAYEVEPGEAWADVAELVAELHAAGLVDRVR